MLPRRLGPGWHVFGYCCGASLVPPCAICLGPTSNCYPRMTNEAGWRPGRNLKFRRSNPRAIPRQCFKLSITCSIVMSFRRSYRSYSRRFFPLASAVSWSLPLWAPMLPTTEISHMGRIPVAVESFDGHHEAFISPIKQSNHLLYVHCLSPT